MPLTSVHSSVPRPVLLSMFLFYGVELLFYTYHIISIINIKSSNIIYILYYVLPVVQMSFYQSGVDACQRLGNAPLPAIKHKRRQAKEQVPVPKLQFTTSGSFILFVLYVCDLFCFLACHLFRHMDTDVYHV